MDFLWGHEQDSPQGPSIHLGHRDGKDQEPGEEAGQAVHQSQQRIAQ